MSEVTWVIPERLARSYRPGRFEWPDRVPAQTIEAWCKSVAREGIRSILCLLAPEQLAFYAELKGGLLGHYRARVFDVVHVPVVDHKCPPLDDAELEQVWKAFQELPAPVLVHCSAGIGRTGAAIRHVLDKMDAGQIAGDSEEGARVFPSGPRPIQSVPRLFC